MKTITKICMILTLVAYTSLYAKGQETTTEYDDVYYIPAKEKAAPAVESPTPNSQQSQSDTEQMDDYEIYIQNLEKQRLNQTESTYEEEYVEYADDPNYMDSNYEEKDGNTYVTNNYYYSDYYDDYYYTSRIRRFYRPFYSYNYYSSWYLDPYWYSPGWSLSFSFGYPYYSYSYWYPYDYFYSPYYSWYGGYYGWHSPYYSWYGGYYGWHRPYYGWGYSPYWSAYDYGYYNGYYAGYYSDAYYYGSSTYYGPRRMIDNNSSVARSSSIYKTSAGNLGNRRTVTSASPATKSATDIETINGRRTVSSGGTGPEAESNNNVNKSAVDPAVNTRRISGTNSDASSSPGTDVSRPATRTVTATEGTNSRETQKSTEQPTMVSPQDLPVYTRPNANTSPSETSGSGTQNNSGTTIMRRATTPQNNTPTYTRPNSSSPSSYSRQNSSAPSFSSPAPQQSNSPSNTRTSTAPSRSSSSSSSSYRSSSSSSSSSRSSSSPSRSSSSSSSSRSSSSSPSRR